MTLYIPELTTNISFFPDVNTALNDPNGLLAMGGDLSPERIINAYKNGIFPWFSEGDPILWWSPDTRAIIKPKHCHISKSMKRVIKKNRVVITLNCAFNDVIECCAQPRTTQAETWITNEMTDAYIALHKQGHAHSVEVWENEELIGGLYGVCVGTLFCGESMFSKVDNSSKIAFIALNQYLYKYKNTLIDCQMQTNHLKRFGVKALPRKQFLSYLYTCREENIDTACWTRKIIPIQAHMHEK